jgi:clan AA aspartic protease
MGLSKVNLKVKNPANPKKSFEDEFLIDSGASFTVVPATELKKLGIKPQGEEQFVLADGKVIKRKVGSALYEYQGIERAAPVLFGQRGDNKLLGVFTLEALGFSLDPLKRKLYKATLRI